LAEAFQEEDMRGRGDTGGWIWTVDGDDGVVVRDHPSNDT